MISERVKARWAEEEWLVLERSPERHEQIARLLSGAEPEDELEEEFGRLLSLGLAGVPSPETRRLAALAIWERLKKGSPPAHAAQAEELIARLDEDIWAIVYLKKLFKVLAAQQGWREFLESSYLKEP